jgi:RNA polymerase sigma-70 factor, ECF subfamily
MRRILVDHARARNAQKRPAADRRLDIEEAYVYSVERPAELLALHEALDRLTGLDPRQGKIVELRCFGGLTVKEVANVLGISERTVKTDWNMARAWLSNVLNGPMGATDSNSV